MAKEVKSMLPKFNTQNVALGLGVAVFVAVMYKTKAFGLLKPKGQKAEEEKAQENVIIVSVTTSVNATTTTVPPFTNAVATQLAIKFHYTLRMSSNLLNGWGWSPTVAEYNNAVGSLVKLSNQQLAQ